MKIVDLIDKLKPMIRQVKRHNTRNPAVLNIIKFYNKAG